MGKWMNCIRVVLSVLDLGSDIYVAVTHRQNGDEVWFYLSVIFIVAPLVIGFAVFCCQRHDVVDLEKTLVLALYIEAMYESAPQWCLQVYIMLRQWEFPWYTITSAVISCLNLTWNATIHELIQTADDVNLVYLVVSFFHELSGFISRLVVIAVFGYVFKFFLFVALASHGVVFMAILNCMEYCCFGSENSGIFKCLGLCANILGFILSYIFAPFLFHPSKAIFALFLENQDRIDAYYIWMYILIVVENIIMLTLVASVPPPEVTHMDVLEPLAMGCVIVGTALNLGFLVFRWLMRLIEPKKLLDRFLKAERANTS